MPQSLSPDYRYCPRCAEPLASTIRGGLPRPTCASCGFVHFRNPAVGVAVVLLDDAGRILLGRRSAGGNVGEWCIPCGYLEWGEDIRDAARREFSGRDRHRRGNPRCLRRTFQLPQPQLPHRRRLVLRNGHRRSSPRLRRSGQSGVVPAPQPAGAAGVSYRPPGAGGVGP